METAVSPGTSGPGTNGLSGSSSPSAPSFATVDPARVVDYLASLLQAALGATRAELEGPGSLLSRTKHADTLQRCTRFATESQVALYIQKELISSENGDDGES